MLYAPGLHDLDTIRTVCATLEKPVNVVMGMPGATFGVRDLAAAGVKRISVGSALARAAFGAFVRASLEIRDKGSFQFAQKAIGFTELEVFFTPFDGAEPLAQIVGANALGATRSRVRSLSGKVGDCRVQILYYSGGQWGSAMQPESPEKAAEPKKEKISFWLTAPGILTGIASVIGAVTGLIVALGQSGIISTSDPPVQPLESKPVPERLVDLEGEVLSMEVPEWWIENPVRGSIDFSNHDQIEETKSVLVGLSVRSEGEQSGIGKPRILGTQ